MTMYVSMYSTGYPVYVPRSVGSVSTLSVSVVS